MAIDPAAVRAHLGALPASLPALQSSLEDPDSPAPRPWLAGVPEPTAPLHALWEEVVVAVQPWLAGPDGPHTSDALGVLARCPVLAAGEAARMGLSSSEAEQRMLAADAVARSGRPDAIELLRPLLDDAFFLVRVRAVGDLGVVGEASALPLLRAALDDAEPMVRRQAAIALGDLGGPSEVPTLQRRAGREAAGLVRDGLRRALEAAGAPDDSLHPLPAFAQAARGAASGDAEGIDWLLDHYRDPATGIPAQLALTALDAEHLPALAERLAAAQPSRRFAAVDVLASRGYTPARDAIAGLERDMEVAVCLAASAGLMRLGEPSTIDEYWLDRFPPLDRLRASAALDLAAPVPDGLVELLLFEPCGLLPGVGAELVRRQGTDALKARLRAALDLEHARLAGDEPPRPDDENDRFVMTPSVRGRWLQERAAIRELLPGGLAETARALEEESFIDPHVVAALGLLFGLRGQAPDEARPALEPWLGSPAPVLRFWALALWVAAHPTLPDPMDGDAHPAVRALWNAVAVPA